SRRCCREPFCLHPDGRCANNPPACGVSNEGTEPANGGERMDLVLRALNRFGLGASIGERSRIRDGRGWVLAQLEAGPPVLAAGADAAEASTALRALRQAQGSRDPAAVAEARRSLMSLATADMTAVLERRLTTEQAFLERLVTFWSNHLCISTAAKGVVAPLAGLYEREAIRPHVLGRFEDMVLASARHPA